MGFVATVKFQVLEVETEASSGSDARIAQRGRRQVVLPGVCKPSPVAEKFPGLQHFAMNTVLFVGCHRCVGERDVCEDGFVDGHLRSQGE